MAAPLAAGTHFSATAPASGAKLPNILVCGTPGTGKTTTAEAIASRFGMRHINIGLMIKERGFHAGLDNEFDAYILDEDAENRLLDELEPIIAAGGAVVDFHSVDFFPERFFDLVLVLRTDNTILYDRLVARGYRPNKIEENITAEIMQVVLEEARDSYPAEIVCEVPSNSDADMESTLQRVGTWMNAWQAEHPA